jgi:hypothetical protein
MCCDSKHCAVCQVCDSACKGPCQFVRL